MNVAKMFDNELRAKLLSTAVALNAANFKQPLTNIKGLNKYLKI